MMTRALIVMVGLLSVFNCLPLKAQQRAEIDSLNHVLAKMPDDSNKVKTYRLLFIATINGLSANQSIPIALQQLALAKKVHYQLGQATGYKLLGVAYWSLGDLEKAVHNYLLALKAYEHIKNEQGIAGCYTNLGLVYKKQNELGDALYYFKKALTTWKAIGKTESVCYELSHIGEVYEAQGKDSAALNHYLQAYELSKKTNNKALKGLLLYHTGGIFFKFRQYPLASYNLAQALNLTLASKENYPVPEIYIILSKIAIAEQRFNDALAMAKKSLAVAQQANYNVTVPDSYAQMSKAYAALNNYKAAYQYQSASINMRDSMISVENIRKIDRLQYHYQLEKKEIINQNLLKDKRLKEQQILLQDVTIQHQYFIGGFIVFAMVSLIILSMLFHRNMLAKKRENEQLNRHDQEIMQQNQEINRQKEHLSELNATKDRLFSIISHDLRSPVATLQELLKFANDGLFTGEELLALLPKLSGEVSSTLTMLDNTLNWALSQMDGLILKPRIFEIDELINQNIDAYKTQALNKKITLVSDQLSAVKVFADFSTIDIVLRNLVANAIKFCKAGDSITIAAQISNNICQVSVTDTGKGISPQMQQMLFISKNIHSTTGTANEKGTGLGLVLCKDLVQMNGGEIWIDPAYTGGSKFIFTLPAA